MTKNDMNKRHKQKSQNRFNDDGEPIDDHRNRWVLLDRYLATEPGTAAAVHAMAELLEHYPK